MPDYVNVLKAAINKCQKASETSVRQPSNEGDLFENRRLFLKPTKIAECEADERSKHMDGGIAQVILSNIQVSSEYL